MKLQDAGVAAAKKQGIDEVLVIYTSKLELKEWIGERQQWRDKQSIKPLQIERARLLLREYSECALIIGKDATGFTEALKKIEDELHAKGFYKAWAVCNDALKNSLSMPCHMWFNIDIVATLARYKKNMPVTVPGDYPPWGIILVQ